MLFQPVHPALEILAALADGRGVAYYALKCSMRLHQIPVDIRTPARLTNCLFALVMATLSLLCSERKPTSRAALLRTKLRMTACRHAISTGQHVVRADRAHRQTHLPLLSLHTVDTPDYEIRMIFPEEISNMRDLRLVRRDDGNLRLWYAEFDL
jgi:hypothetical protein